MLAGFHLGVRPVAGVLRRLDDEILVGLREAVEEGPVDQHPAGLDEVVGDDQVGLHLIQVEGGDLRQVALGGLGPAGG